VVATNHWVVEAAQLRLEWSDRAGLVRGGPGSRQRWARGTGSGFPWCLSTTPSASGDAILWLAPAALLSGGVDLGHPVDGHHEAA